MRVIAHARSWAAGALITLCLTAHGAHPDCVPQTRIDVTRIDKQVVLVGESHGTNEIPAFVAGLVCGLLREGRSVILAVEHSGHEQAALNRFVMSTGGPADRAALIDSSANWKRYADGRGSVAMFRMIDDIRRLRAEGQRVGVLAFERNDNLDVPTEEADRISLGPADNALQNRLNDSDMASSILYNAALFRRYVLVVLAGYAHTSTVLAKSNDPMIGTYMPMGQLVSAEMPVYTIGIESGGGEQAAMTESGSGVHPVRAGPLYVSGTVIDAKAHFDHLTASPPARDEFR